MANRGEIAMRIIRACRELNIATAAIYSEADSTGIYVKKADESYMVGPGPVKGFLDSQQIVDLPTDRRRCHPSRLWISLGKLAICPAVPYLRHHLHRPIPASHHLMGSKVKAREIGQTVGVPIVPGTEGGVTDVKEALWPSPKESATRHDQSQRRRRRTRPPGGAVGCRTAREHGGGVTGGPGGLRRRKHLSSKSISNGRIISNSRSWPTGMATSSIWASAIARFSAGIKSSSKSPPP